jgi:hypothetical protein
MNTTLEGSTALKRLNHGLNLLQHALLEHGGIAIDAAPESIERFDQSSPDKQEQILQNISAYLRILDQEIIEPLPIKTNKDIEVARLKKALNEFGLKALDDSIFKLIGENDVVEIYNNLGVQVYRNMKFTKICSYNLLDLAVNSWEELYIKPAATANELHHILHHAFTTADKTFAYNVKTYVQKDKFAYAKVLRATLVTFKYISPLIDASTGERAGIISTLTAEMLAEGEDSAKYTVI